jgi:hypothetical protein
MKTADDYLMKYGIRCDDPEIESAMDAFAKDIALSFSTFKAEYQRLELQKVKEHERKIGGMITWIGAPDEKIFQEFLKQQK